MIVQPAGTTTNLVKNGFFKSNCIKPYQKQKPGKPCLYGNKELNSLITVG